MDAKHENCIEIMLVFKIDTSLVGIMIESAYLEAELSILNASIDMKIET